MKLLLLPILTVSTVGGLERILYRCQAPSEVPLSCHCI